MSSVVDLEGVIGPCYIGVVVATTLLGVSIVQAYYYYRDQNDPWTIKWLVAAVMFLDTGHQAFITYTVYIYVVSKEQGFHKLVLDIAIETIPNSLTALLVQGFLTARVWRLSNGNILLTTVITLLVLAGFASVVAYQVLVIPLKTLDELRTIKPLSLTINLLAAVGDLVIALALCFLLHKSRTGFQKSDTMINKLIMFAVNTGLLTSLCAVASFISYMAAPNALIYILFYFCIGRLYTNSLLATLNVRRILRNGSDNTQNNTADKVTLSLREFPKKCGTNSRNCGKSNISIKIDTTKEYVTDLIHDQEQDHDSEKNEKTGSNAV